MVEIALELADPDVIMPAPWQGMGRAGKLQTSPFVSPVQDFFRTDPISRASAVMAECSALHLPSGEATGTHG
jgi:NADH-quinone oxidoreductase subunit G